MFSLVQLNGLSFNSDPHYWITGTSGLGKPPTRQVDYDLPGQNFGVFVSALYGGRPFTISGTIIGDSMSDFVLRRDALYAACDIINGEVPIIFTLANGRQVQINAACQDIDIPGQPGSVVASDFNAQFKANFPFLLSPTITPFSIALPVGGGGTVPLPTVPTGLSGNQGGVASITNNGNAPFWPTARIYGPVTNPQILNNTLNLSLQLTITLASGQYVDIDFKRKTIVDNFGTNQYSSKSGDWWYLPKGVSVIAFSAASYSSSALCTIFAQDSWLGI